MSENNQTIPVDTNNLTTVSISMAAYHDLWRREANTLQWTCPFVLPFWLETVCAHLGAPGDPTILVVSDNNRVIGVVPLALSDRCAFFLGHPSVCDYQDIVSIPGKAAWVMQAVMNHLAKHGIDRMDLGTLRPDAAVLAGLKSIDQHNDRKTPIVPDDVTFETDLPDSWDGFLLQLSSKQRHEVRRKTRRLASQGNYTFKMAPNDESLSDAMDTFIRLFQMNRSDKADFMDQTMASYFKSLILSLAKENLLRLYFLDLDGQPAATALCFDYGNVRYLYNSGYDAQYQSFSVGILCKVFSIQKGIEAGCRHYDFLKGSEIYKKRTGGQEVTLYRYRLTL